MSFLSFFRLNPIPRDLLRCGGAHVPPRPPPKSDIIIRNNTPTTAEDRERGRRRKIECASFPTYTVHGTRESVEKKVNDSNAAREKIHGDCDFASEEAAFVHVGKRSAFAGEEITFFLPLAACS